MSGPTRLSTARVHLVEGAGDILAMLPDLLPCAEAWGQAADLAELPYFFSLPSLPGRKPLLLVVKSPVETGGEDVLGAELLYAYGASWLGNTLLTNADRVGRVGVFGPNEDRLEIGVTAVRALMQRGPRLVRLHFAVEEASDPSGGVLASLAARKRAAAHFEGSGPGVFWHLHRRERPYNFPLCADLDETLAGMGKLTRRNLRAYTRACVRDLGSAFEPKAAPSVAEFMKLNRASKFPVAPRVARWRLASAQSGSGFLAGLRTAQGDWMALAGGRRVGDTAIIDWQMNSPAYARYSVSLVMRGYLIELFGREGKPWLYVDGGTAHVMAERFRKRAVYMLSAERPVLWLRLLGWLLRTFLPQRAITRRFMLAREKVKASEHESDGEG